MNCLCVEKEKIATIWWGQFLRLFIYSGFPVESSSLTYFYDLSFSNTAMYQRIFSTSISIFDFFYLSRSVLEIIYLSFEKVGLKTVFCYQNCSIVIVKKLEIRGFFIRPKALEYKVGPNGFLFT